jgi:hypothetical protein
VLHAALGAELRFSIAATERGLFIEIAEEVRAVYGAEARLSFLRGRDAAERIVNWDYGRPGAIEQMLEVFDLLVASRQGEYAPPDHLRAASPPWNSKPCATRPPKCAAASRPGSRGSISCRLRAWTSCVRFTPVVNRWP